MHVLFEEAGKFMAGRVLSEAEASSQVELDSGKRVKIKAANILIKFEKPAPAELLAQAAAVAETIELELAWEFAPEGEFSFADLARDYFSADATLAQQAGALFRLFEAPHYFRRAGKGRFKKAPAEILQQALAAIEKKKVIQQLITDWSAELAAGRCPEPIREQLFKILFRPDKNAPEYKAVVEASRATRLPPLALLQQAGAIASPYQFHWQRFLLDHFPKGTGFPALQAPPITDDLPLAAVQAYSIDDSQTTEIDDALSVQGLGSGTVVVGIHIAAPGLAITPGSAIDLLGRQRLSTVYMPGYKITMLPDDVVQTYTLSEGRDVPAVSLYVALDEATLEIKATETRLERVPITANLRHDQLDGLITAEWLENPEFEHQNAQPPAPIGREVLSFLYRLAKDLKARREVVRGKPENFNRPDYNFRLVGNEGNVPTGEEPVQISTRQRGAPLDLIVAEAMILANSTWGSWMAELGVPGIYRSQASPGARREGAHGHQGAAARGHRREELRLEHLAPAPLHRPGEPVADHRLRPPRQDGRAGRAVQAQGRRAVLHHQRLRCRLQRLQRLPGRHGALLDAEIPGAAGHHRTGGHHLQGRPRRQLAGARRRAAAGLPGAGRAGADARRAAARAPGRGRRDCAGRERHRDRASGCGAHGGRRHAGRGRTRGRADRDCAGCERARDSTGR
jgi:exoribonuclease-2